MRLYTCLDATLSGPVGLGARTNLWITATRRSDAQRMLADRGITYRENAFGGPVRPGPATAGVQRAGLADQPAVYAYPTPWTPDTPVMRIDSPSTSTAVTTMGDVMPHLVTPC
jgi:hypothetical protein